MKWATRNWTVQTGWCTGKHRESFSVWPAILVDRLGPGGFYRVTVVWWNWSVEVWVYRVWRDEPMGRFHLREKA